MLGLALAVTIAATASVTPPEPKQWACHGSADGPLGTNVDVTFFTLRDGDVVHRTITWDPPKIEGKIYRRGLRDDAPDLTLFYDDARPDNMGKVSMVLTGVSGLKRTETSSVVARLDEREDLSWRADLERTLGIPEYPISRRSGYFAEWGEIDPTTRQIYSLHEGMGTAGIVRLTLLDSKKRVLGWTYYRVGERELRDQLFIKAWAAAELASKRPTSCNPTLG